MRWNFWKNGEERFDEMNDDWWLDEVPQNLSRVRSIDVFAFQNSWNNGKVHVSTITHGVNYWKFSKFNYATVRYVDFCTYLCTWGITLIDSFIHSNDTRHVHFLVNIYTLNATRNYRPSFPFTFCVYIILLLECVVKKVAISFRRIASNFSVLPFHSN